VWFVVCGVPWDSGPGCGSGSVWVTLDLFVVCGLWFFLGLLTGRSGVPPRVPEKTTIHKPQTSQESQKKTQSTNHKPSPDIRKESLSKAIKSLRKPIKSLWKPIGPGNKVLRIDHTNLREFVYYRDHGSRRLCLGGPIGPHRAPWDPTIMGPYRI